MGQLGVYMVIFGIGSIVLNLLDREFMILMWVDNWGPSVGWGIRIGMIVVGGALALLAAAAGGGDPEVEESE